jgi:hypothetical protein
MSEDNMKRANAPAEFPRLFQRFQSDYVHAAYHLDRYLQAGSYPEVHAQEALRDAVLALNVLRASANALFDLLQPRADFTGQQKREL